MCKTHKPAPTRALDGQRLRVELLDQLLKAPKRLDDRLPKRAVRVEQTALAAPRRTIAGLCVRSKCNLAVYLLGFSYVLTVRLRARVLRGTGREERKAQQIRSFGRLSSLLVEELR